MMVRIPAENLEAFIFGINDLGYFISGSKIDIDDKSLEYLAAQQKQAIRKGLLARTGIKKITDTSLTGRVQIADQVITSQIANRQINADAKYSTVVLTLVQSPLIVKEMIANYDINHYQLPYGERLSNAMATGVEYFLSFMVTLTRLWMFVLAAITVWFTYRHFHNKKKSIGNTRNTLTPAEK